jgi:hypothetical protein
MEITTQTAAIKAALLKGEVITPIDALNRFGCMRLGARIWDLRNEGLPVEMVLADGKKKYAKYFISPVNLSNYRKEAV